MACRTLLTALFAATSACFCSCSSTTNLADAKVYKHDGRVQIDNAKYYQVKTTAYSHVESDSLKYGLASAEGGNLHYGMFRSAASDWSVFPLGTVFKIEGLPYIYRIDDYGSALVGTKTIDLYKPDMAGIKDWGARNVRIKVIKWGSYNDSLAILGNRTSYPHVKAMVESIRRNLRG